MNGSKVVNMQMHRNTPKRPKKPKKPKKNIMVQIKKKKKTRFLEFDPEQHIQKSAHLAITIRLWTSRTTDGTNLEGGFF